MVILGLAVYATAHPVNQETAQVIAAKFMGTSDMYLSTIYHTNKNDNAFYIFNTSKGFVIVSADDCETPIIGYSHEGRFDPNNIPVQMEDYLRDFVARIQYGIENHIVASETTAKQWHLVKAIGRLNNKKNAKAVEPLITARWHQGCLYNSLCPAMENTPCGHAEVGCVAVAMAQIMHYWKFPQTGVGSHSYFNAGLTLTADFGNTEYDWDHIPDYLNETSSDTEIEAVATLLYHCGVSVEMSYGTNGSGASSNDIPYALKSYFKYSKDLHREKKDNDNAVWLARLKDCLDLLRPILYSGYGSAGHAFICDGYDDNDLLHFNWGWGGSGDGYFALGNLNPIGHNYNNSNIAIFDITPNNMPYNVSASANPPAAGFIEGTGEHPCDEAFVLSATPNEDYDFYCWKRGFNIVSYDSVYSFFTQEDIDDLEALFTLKPARNITANASSQQIIYLSWGNRDIYSWPLLYQFEANAAQGISTDGNFIYINKANSNSLFKKYTMDGAFVDAFNVNGCAYPSELTYNGSFFYCNGKNTDDLYAVDLANKKLLHTINTGYTPICSYDYIHDGIWITSNVNNSYQLKLIDQTGALIKNGPHLPSDMVPNGSGFIVSADGNSHLIIKTQEGLVYDYDISNGLLNRNSLIDCGTSLGAHIGKYNGEDALYVSYSNAVRIFEIKKLLTQIIHYRLYRADNEGNIIRIADGITGTSYADPTWNDLAIGLYRFGISSVFGNGEESEIVWSDPVKKGNYGVNENAMDVTTVYPNPASDKLIVESPSPVRQCEIFTIDGKLMYSSSNCGEKIIINTKSWASGIYIARLSTDAIVETKRFVIDNP